MGSRARRRRWADGVAAVVLGLTEQLVGRREFGVRGYRWCGNIVPPRLPAAELEALVGQARAICCCLAGAFALRGLFGVDFIWDGERAWTVEVNPRPTASLEAIEAAYGMGVFDAHLRGCAGELRRVEAERAGAAGKASSSPPRTSSSATACAGWSAACATSRIRASASPRAVRSARSWRLPRRRRGALAGLEVRAARLRAELEAHVEVATGA